MRVLLDTCTFIWLALEPARLSSPAVAVINDPANDLFLSDVSVWEITLKNTAGKLTLPDSPRHWIPSRRSFFGLVPLPIAESHILRTADLPQVHPDPFDRLLAAQSLEAGFTILSPDAALSTLQAARMW